MGNKIKTTEEFITESEKIHKGRYSYENSVFINYNSNVEIICKEHGSFFQRASRHMLGGNCIKCGNESRVKKQSNVIKDFKKVHGDLYDYSKVDYKGHDKKITIICKIHGEFEQEPQYHKCGRGCFKCSNNVKLNNKEFIKRSIEVHGDLYDYSKVDYRCHDEKVTIICKIHGEFEQIARNHYVGNGCFKCFEEARIGYYENVEDWIRVANSSKNFHSYKFYVVNLYNDDESFYKFGITFRDIKKRFNILKDYKYRIIKIIEGEPEEIFNIEKKLKEDTKHFYIPKVKFAGHTECVLNLSFIDKILI